MNQINRCIFLYILQATNLCTKRIIKTHLDKSAVWWLWFIDFEINQNDFIKWNYNVTIHDEISIKMLDVCHKIFSFPKKVEWHIKIKMIKSNTSKILSIYWTNFWCIQNVSIINASKINILANFVFFNVIYVWTKQIF